MEKYKGILITFQMGKEESVEKIHFQTEMSEKKLREDVKTRIKQYLNDLFKNVSQFKTYKEKIQAIHDKANAEQCLYMYENIVQRFQHSNVWDYLSEERANEQVGSELWIIIDGKKRSIEIKDVKDNFRDLMEDIVGKKINSKKNIKEIAQDLYAKTLKNNCKVYYRLLVNQKKFKYNGKEFIPVFEIEGKKKDDAWKYMSDRITNTSRERNTFNGKAYKINDFLKADEAVNKGSKADIYLCIEDGKLYCPASTTLMEYWDVKGFA